MKTKLILFLLLLPSIILAQRNKDYDNLDIKNKLYIGGDMIYKGVTYPSYSTLQSVFANIGDTTLFEFIPAISDTSVYISINDTVTLGYSGVTTPKNVISSNNQYAIFTADDTAYANYLFTPTDRTGNITGINLSIEYKMTYDTGSYYIYFKEGNYTTDSILLPIRLTSDTIMVFGGINNLLGLDVLLDSLIIIDSLNVQANILDLLEDETLSIGVTAYDSTLSIDHIKLRYYYTTPIEIIEKLNYRTNLTSILLDTLYYAPINPIKGTLYMDTDGHFYGFDGSTWKQLDN